MKIEIEQREKYVKYAMIFSVAYMIIGAVMNYLTWSQGPVDFEGNIFGNIFQMGMWIFLYVPMFCFIVKLDYRPSEFGLNGYKAKREILCAAALLLTAAVIVLMIMGHISIANILEGFARTGEEVFFRGFLFVLFIELFKNKEKPYKWAIVFASLSFAAVHTQTFIHNGTSMFDIFLIALLLTSIRHYTRTIIFGVILHCFLNNGMYAVLIGTLIYLVIALFESYNKTKEDMKKRISAS